MIVYGHFFIVVGHPAAGRVNNLQWWYRLPLLDGSRTLESLDSSFKLFSQHRCHQNKFVGIVQ